MIGSITRVLAPGAIFLLGLSAGAHAWARVEHVPARRAAPTNGKELARALARKNLTHLDLWSYEGPLDLRDLATLTALRELYLCVPQVANLAPLDKLANLERLDLRETKAADFVPLSRLAKLRTLVLGKCPNLTDLTFLTSMPRLTFLAIVDCRGVRSLQPLSRLAALERLDLASLGPAPLDLAPLLRLTKLRDLSLSRLEVRDFEQVGRMTQLNRLLLIEVGATSFAPIARLTGLSSLHIIQCDGVKDLAFLHALPGLADFQLGQRGGAIDLTPMGACTKLRFLYLSSAALRGLDALGKLSRLECLRITACSGLARPSPLGRLARLETLDLTGCRDLADLTALGKLANLTKLNLGHCRNVADISPLARLAKLRRLSLADCKRITDLGPLARLVQLKELDLMGCDGIVHLAPLVGHVRRGCRIKVAPWLRDRLKRLPKAVHGL